MAKRKMVVRAATMTPAAAEAHLRGVVLGEGRPAWECEIDRLVELGGAEVEVRVRALVCQRLQALADASASAAAGE